MLRIDGPCLECKDRYVGCHGKCERYKAWSDKHNIIRKNSPAHISIDAKPIDYRRKVHRS